VLLETNVRHAPGFACGDSSGPVRKFEKIGLLHHIGGGNLGDDATQAALLQNIRRRWPHAQIFGFSMNPEDTLRRHGIPSYAIRRTTWALGYTAAVENEVTFKSKTKGLLSQCPPFLKLIKLVNTVAVRTPRALLREAAFLRHSFQTLKSFDLLIINGGGQLTEWTGPWGFLYTIFKWVALARLANVKCVFLNVGAGPLTRPLSKFFARRALSLATYVSFRDEDSRSLAQRIGFAGTSHVFPDSAYSLAIPTAAVPGGIKRPPKTIVGVSPMPYCDPRIFPEKDQSAYDAYIRKLGRFSSWLVGNECSVALFGSDIGIDPLAVDDLLNALRRGGDTAVSGSVITEQVSSGEELLFKMSRMDYVVTSRFHGVVFAHLLNKPVVAISHHPKVAALMDEMGLAEYCVDIRRFDLNLLTETFSTLVRNHDEIKDRMAQKLVSYRHRLTGQFDDLFPQDASR
jgi:polysaccharide pyruvyl transferase WcaK-like protein